jgi:hypothetical protein
MRTIKILVAAAFVAVGGFAAASTLTNAPEKAEAHSCSFIAYHPTDQSWACASGPSGAYKACDYDVDGHRVRAHIDTSAGPEEVDRQSAWAPSQGCSEPEGVQYGGNHILKIRSCTEGEGCGPWVRVR